jgi:hypothetical protein
MPSVACGAVVACWSNLSFNSQGSEVIVLIPARDDDEGRS